MELGIGIIEGFYGTPWSQDDRLHAVHELKKWGGQFYLYAPKGDPFLRKRWTEAYPKGEAEKLKELGVALHQNNLSFGVGLSPYELYRSFDENAKTMLRMKLLEIAELGVDHLALLFDDMRGDLPNLAELQIAVIRFVQSFHLFKTISFCPTYYSDDPILDKVFGQRPDGYLETLRKEVDPGVHFFWTGEKVCSADYPSQHLERVTRELGRKPFLWDNYPVNDGQRMCKFLHLKEFTHRPARLKHELSGHAVNPMNEARLSWIPIRTLFQSYQDEPVDWLKAATDAVGIEMAQALSVDLKTFHEEGREAIGEERRQAYIKKYESIAHPAAQEVVKWLKGDFEVTRELVLTQ